MHVPHTPLLNLLKHTTRQGVERRECGTNTREKGETERNRKKQKEREATKVGEDKEDKLVRE